LSAASDAAAPAFNTKRRASSLVNRFTADRRPGSSSKYETSVNVARRQEGKFWELRAAVRLAGLWRDQGKVQQARDLLAAVYSWFTEGFDTLDLREAKALLGEMHA
jgi:predicted ATPase